MHIHYLLIDLALEVHAVKKALQGVANKKGPESPRAETGAIAGEGGCCPGDEFRASAPITPSDLGIERAPESPRGETAEGGGVFSTGGDTCPQHIQRIEKTGLEQEGQNVQPVDI